MKGASGCCRVNVAEPREAPCSLKSGLLIHSFSTIFSSSYYVPVNVLEARDSRMKKTLLL